MAGWRAGGRPGSLGSAVQAYASSKACHRETRPSLVTNRLSNGTIRLVTLPSFSRDGVSRVALDPRLALQRSVGRGLVAS